MNKEEQRLIMSEEEMLSLEKIASERNMTIEEVEKYREYSSRSLNGEEWIEYLKLCEKAFKKTSKYLYIYEHEIKQINNYITNLQQENQQLKEIEKEHQRINGNLREEIKELKYKINNLILFAYGTEMSLGEFEGIFKLAFDKEHNPKIPIEKQVGGKQ